MQPHIHPDSHLNGLLHMWSSKCSRRREYEALDKQRRAEGRELLAFFTGDWKLLVPVHHCYGCCRDRDDAVVRGFDVFKRTIMRRVFVTRLTHVAIAHTPYHSTSYVAHHMSHLAVESHEHAAGADTFTFSLDPIAYLRSIFLDGL